MISDRAKAILAEGVGDDEKTVIFLEEGPLCCIFRLFRVSEGAGDPEERAVQWLGKVKGLRGTARGGLRTGIVRSRDGSNVMAAVSGRDIGVREWLQKTDDSRQLSTREAAR